MARKRSREETECPCLYGDCKQHQLMESMPLEERWKVIDEAITKALKILDDDSNVQFTVEESKDIYSCAFTLTGRRASPNCASQLSEKFVFSVLGCIFLKVLPFLRNKADEPSLLLDLMHVWTKYKALACWLAKFFEPLESFCFQRLGISLYHVSVVFFSNVVCRDFFEKFQDAALYLINQVREGNPTDHVLLVNVIKFFVEIGESWRSNDQFYREIGEDGRPPNYSKKFEHAMLQHAANYYSLLASQWVLRYPVGTYMEKVEGYLYQEEIRMGLYLPQTVITKLLEVVRCQFLDNQARTLIERILNF